MIKEGKINHFVRNVRHALSFFAAYSEVKWSKNTLDPEEKGLGQRD